ncbi:MAG: MurR/RpiR family transcriptional regulator [Lachnospiraceae bacterium]|nr:MurR/RpiR family transcriptional regulator [Lachnospiraceae bacterium]
MLEQMSLLQRMEAKKKDFSKGQRRLAAYIMEDYGRASVLTAQKLGEEAGVSESTVVRFAYQLEYDGYPELQKALRVLVKTKSTSVDRLNLIAKLSEREDLLTSILQKDAERIRTSLNLLESDQFDRAVDMLDHADCIYILGTKSSSFLAGLLGYYLNIFMDHVRVIESNNVLDTMEQLNPIQEGDVFIGVSFPRYSKRTLQAFDFARRQGASTIAISDHPRAPLMTYADCKLSVKSDVVGIVDSLVAAQSLINALIIALSIKRKDDVERRLNKLEKLWNEYDVYENNDEM